MDNSIRLRLHQKGDRAEVEIQVMHPMDPGDETASRTGRSRPPLYLQSIAIQLNGTTVVEGQLSASLSANPKFSFSFSGVKTGDKFTVSCTDNRGTEFKNEVVARS